MNLVLNFRSNTEKYPIIVLPESPEVFQFEESKVSISIYNVDKSSLVTIEAPEWIDLLQVGNLNNYQINFFPREGHLGNHQIFIVTASTEGVVYRKPLNFKVVPRIVSESNSLPVIEKGWLDSWFGKFLPQLMVGITISNLVGFSFLPKKMEPNYGFGILNWNGFGQIKNFGRMIMAPIFSQRIRTIG